MYLGVLVSLFFFPWFGFPRQLRSLITHCSLGHSEWIYVEQSRFPMMLQLYNSYTVSVLLITKPIWSNSWRGCTMSGELRNSYLNTTVCHRDSHGNGRWSQPTPFESPNSSFCKVSSSGLPISWLSSLFPCSCNCCIERFHIILHFHKALCCHFCSALTSQQYNSSHNPLCPEVFSRKSNYCSRFG